ncbi:hypothetical protein KCP76_15165 [Salmonella enterica subsp. enterica serovar Weltevreden]|nr:hypothetical protein KCP76_15165 [Salmonella enterica subsp. enterica serovar Weltevreden]
MILTPTAAGQKTRNAGGQGAAAGLRLQRLADGGARGNGSICYQRCAGAADGHHAAGRALTHLVLRERASVTNGAGRPDGEAVRVRQPC